MFVIDSYVVYHGKQYVRLEDGYRSLGLIRRSFGFDSALAESKEHVVKLPGFGGSYFMSLDAIKKIQGTMHAYETQHQVVDARTGQLVVNPELTDAVNAHKQIENEILMQMKPQIMEKVNQIVAEQGGHPQLSITGEPSQQQPQIVAQEDVTHYINQLDQTTNSDGTVTIPQGTITSTPVVDGRTGEVVTNPTLS